MTPIQHCQDFTNTPADTDKDRDLLLRALMLKYRGEGRWKPIVLHYNRLALGPERDRDWVARGAKKIQTEHKYKRSAPVTRFEATEVEETTSVKI